MAQFDIYVNPNPVTRAQYPYLLDIQHSLHERLATRLIAPLSHNVQRLKKLMPAIAFQNKEYFALITEATAMSKADLGAKLGNASEHRTEIIDAMDLLINGF